MRDARAVMHVGIAYLRWRGKRSRHSRRMRTRNLAYLARGPLASVSPGVSWKCLEIWQDAHPSCPTLRYCYIYHQTVKYTLELTDLFMITYMLISLRVWQNISCSKSILLIFIDRFTHRHRIWYVLIHYILSESWLYKIWKRLLLGRKLRNNCRKFGYHSYLTVSYAEWRMYPSAI